ncbi:MAG: alpha/beta hydrolase, partial [Clostridiales bacterium]
NSSTDYQAAEGILRKIFVKVVNEDLRSYLSQIGIPTLLIWGAKDTATPLTDGQLMEREIADAGLVVFEQSGHYPFLEEPARFHLIVDYFLTHDE